MTNKQICPECKKDKSVRKKQYVGSLNDFYFYCSECRNTFGGEETSKKKNLISGAGLAYSFFSEDKLERA